MSSAGLCLWLTLVALTPEQLPWGAGAAAAWAWSLETIRRFSPRANRLMMWFFGPVAREDEWHRVNSGTWYMTALVLLALTYSTTLCVVGVTVLGVGDPVAGWVGRRFGRHRLASGRSWEGSLAFFVAAAGATIVTLGWLPSPLALGTAITIATVSAAVAAVTEALTRGIDDNLTIPLAAAAAAALTLTAFGLGLDAGMSTATP